MSPRFEVFDPRVSRRGRADPRSLATIEANGSLRLNAAAHDLIGRAEAVALLYDKNLRLLALRRAERTDPAAYASSTGMVSIRALLSYYGLRKPVCPVIVEPELVDDVLVVDLAGLAEESPGTTP
jgi:hypothetical protein